MTSTFFPPTFSTPEMATTQLSHNAGVVYFHIADYVVMVITLASSMAIGIYFAFVGGQQKTTEEYFKGNRNMSLFPVVLSLMASFLSSNGMLGTPAEIYLHGFNFWFMVIGSIVGVPLAIYCFLPVFYDLQVTSVYEYLEKRYNQRVRICGSLLCITTTVIYAGFVIYGPSLALSQVTGLSVWGSVLTTTIIGSLYTSLGGIKAVLWTDAIQLIIFSTALSVAVVKGVLDVDGITNVIDRAKEGGRLSPVSFSLDPTIRFTFWGCAVYGTLRWMNMYGINQIHIQRYLCCPTKKAAKRSVWLNHPGIICVISLYCFLGIILYANYWNCDPLRSSQVSQPDQIFPLFVMQVMRDFPGLPGLFVAGVYSASLSTTSSQLNSLAAITLEDYVRPRWKNISDAKATKISKFIALSYGAVCLFVVGGVSQLGSILQSFAYLIAGSEGANLGLFTLGFWIPFSNSLGSMIGMVCGLITGWWISLGNQIHRPVTQVLPISVDGCNATLGNWTQYFPTPRNEDVFPVYKMSYFWVMPLAWFITLFVGSLASFLLGGNRASTDQKLYAPPVRYFLRKWRDFKQLPQDDLSNGTKSHPPPYDQSVEIPMLVKKA